MPEQGSPRRTAPAGAALVPVPEQGGRWRAAVRDRPFSVQQFSPWRLLGDHWPVITAKSSVVRLGVSLPSQESRRS